MTQILTEENTIDVGNMLPSGKLAFALVSVCVCRLLWFLMPFLCAHSRKPASDILSRDYLIGGVVWVKREVCLNTETSALGAKPKIPA